MYYFFIIFEEYHFSFMNNKTSTLLQLIMSYLFTRTWIKMDNIRIIKLLIALRVLEKLYRLTFRDSN